MGVAMIVDLASAPGVHVPRRPPAVLTAEVRRRGTSQPGHNEGRWPAADCERCQVPGRGPVWKGAARVVCLGGSRARPASPGGRNPPTFALRSAGDRAVAAPSSRVLGDGVPQVAAVDVWPEAGGEEQFGVRGVPREEVGRALLGTGPPQ